MSGWEKGKEKDVVVGVLGVKSKIRGEVGEKHLTGEKNKILRKEEL